MCLGDEGAIERGATMEGRTISAIVSSRDRSEGTVDREEEAGKGDLGNGLWGVNRQGWGGGAVCVGGGGTG